MRSSDAVVSVVYCNLQSMHVFGRFSLGACMTYTDWPLLYVQSRQLWCTCLLVVVIGSISASCPGLWEGGMCCAEEEGSRMEGGAG